MLIGTLLTSCGHLSFFRANNTLMNGTAYKLSHKHFTMIILLIYIQQICALTFLQFQIRREQDGIFNAKRFLTVSSLRKQ